MSWASASVSDQQAKGGGRDGKLSQNLQRRRTSRRITLVRIEPDNIFVKPLVYGIDNDTRPLHSDSFGIVALLLVGINSRIIPGPLIQVQPILLVVRPHEWIDGRRGPLPPALRMPPKPYAVGWVSSHVKPTHVFVIDPSNRALPKDSQPTRLEPIHVQMRGVLNHGSPRVERRTVNDEEI